MQKSNRWLCLYRPIELDGLLSESRGGPSPKHGQPREGPRLHCNAKDRAVRREDHLERRHLLHPVHPVPVNDVQAHPLSHPVSPTSSRRGVDGDHRARSILDSSYLNSDQGWRLDAVLSLLAGTLGHDSQLGHVHFGHAGAFSFDD